MLLFVLNEETCNYLKNNLKKLHKFNLVAACLTYSHSSLPNVCCCQRCKFRKQMPIKLDTKPPKRGRGKMKRERFD